jgi:hypothetical protein
LCPRYTTKLLNSNTLSSNNDFYFSILYILCGCSQLEEINLIVGILVKLEKKKGGVLKKYLLEYSKLTLRNVIFTKSNQESEFSKIIKQESYCHSLKEEITKCVNFHLHFWEMLEEDSPNQRNIEYIGAQILKRVNKAEEVWNILTEMKIITVKIAALYSSYTSLILQDEYQSSTIKEMYSYNIGYRTNPLR